MHAHDAAADAIHVRCCTANRTLKFRIHDRELIQHRRDDVPGRPRPGAASRACMACRLALMCAAPRVGTRLEHELKKLQVDMAPGFISNRRAMPAWHVSHAGRTSVEERRLAASTLMRHLDVPRPRTPGHHTPDGGSAPATSSADKDEEAVLGAWPAWYHVRMEGGDEMVTVDTARMQAHDTRAPEEIECVIARHTHSPH